MSGGEPSSIKQKPSCAAELPILSPKCGKAAGCVCSNCLRAVLWSTELIRLKPRFQSNGIYRSLRLGYIPTGQKFLPMVETFAPTCIKNRGACPRFLCVCEANALNARCRASDISARKSALSTGFEAGLRPSLFYNRNCGGRVSLCIRLYTANGGRRPLRT